MAYNNRGGLYEYEGEHDRAITDLDRAIAIDPKLAMAYANRGASYLGKGDADRALADYDRAIELQPRDPKAFAARAKSKPQKRPDGQERCRCPAGVVAKSQQRVRA
jgi:tetratricopeptide (TPR) repeat protein